MNVNMFCTSRARDTISLCRGYIRPSSIPRSGAPRARRTEAMAALTEKQTSRRDALISTTIGFSALSLFHLNDGIAASDKVFFDLKIEGAPAAISHHGCPGRIVVELFDDVNTGSSRFRDLAVGKEGVGYRLSRVDGIYDSYLRVAGVQRLSYSASGDSAIAGGDSVAELEAEISSASHKHDEAGLVSLFVLEAAERPIQEKLIAKGGKLVTIQMQAGEAPNGTGFMITRGPAPELDKTNLVIGRVVQGMDVVERIASLPFSRPRTEWYDSPFFEAGKAMGDKRAVVAEKGFNRPLKRVIITASGLA